MADDVTRGDRDRDGTLESSDDGEYYPVYENRVRFAETDQQGIVFYGEYVTFQDEAMSAFLRALGYDYETIRERGWVIHVVSTQLDYRHPARFEDVVVNEMWIEGIGESSIDFGYRARRKADDRTLVEGSVTHVAVDDETGDPIRVPDDFRDAVASFQGGVEGE